MLAHFRNGQLLATYAVGFGVLFNFICTFTFVSFHLAAPPYNLSATWLGAIFAVYLVGSVLSPLVGWAVTRFGRRRFTVRVLALWIAGIALTLAPSLPLIILGLAISAGCGLICQAISTGYVTITAKAGRSSAVGLYVTSFYVGGSFGAALGGLAWTIAGWPACVALVVAMLADHGGHRATSPGPAACRPGRLRRRSSRRECAILNLDATAAGSRAASTAMIDGGVSTSTSIACGRGRASAVARRRPAQQVLAAYGEGVAAKRDHRAVGQRVDLAPMHALGLAVEALGVQHLVHRGSTGAFALPCANSAANRSASWRRHSKQGR